jgi:hypothetical protein
MNSNGLICICVENSILWNFSTNEDFEKILLHLVIVWSPFLSYHINQDKNMSDEFQSNIKEKFANFYI